MKVTIKGGYEAAKERIYNESLEGKQDELNKIKLFRFDTLNDRFTIMLQIILVVFFGLSFISALYPQTEDATILLRYGTLGVFLFSIILNVWLYKSNKKFYGNYIEKHKSMTMDEYIVWVKNNGYRISFDDEYMIDSYNDLQKFASLLNPDIVSIEYTRVNGELSSNILFFVKKKNNQKDAVDFGLINILYRDSEEDELVWDEDGVITLYTNDKGFVKKKDGEN